jgi:threonyl-tRNA synthetase
MCQALELFADNPFKLSMIKSKLPEGSSTTVYQNGPFVDLCRGRAVVAAVVAAVAAAAVVAAVAAAAAAV